MAATALRWGSGLVVLGVVVTRFDPAEIGRRVAGLDPAWLAAGLGLSILQVAASAWRWRYTAARLDVDMPLRVAVIEYYRSTFLNQVLPGGVVGDVSRAWRHADAEHESNDRAAATEAIHELSARQRAVHAVIFERASGLIVMTVIAAVSLVALDAGRYLEFVEPRGALAPVGAASQEALVILAAVALLVAGALAASRVLKPAVGAARQALVADGAWLVQAATSSVVAATYLLVYVAAARSIGIEAPTGLVLLLVAPVLMAMLLPLTVAGWGFREGAAAALWSAAGIDAGEAVTASVTYGLFVLLSSLPGAVLLLLNRRSGRGRTPHRPRAGRSAPGDAAPH